jgi:hypothetical protein
MSLLRPIDMTLRGLAQVVKLDVRFGEKRADGKRPMGSVRMAGQSDRGYVPRLDRERQSRYRKVASEWDSIVSLWVERR